MSTRSPTPHLAQCIPTLADSLNIELTFKSGYSFNCTNCGICCQYVGGISLTSRERDIFSKSLDAGQFSSVNHAAFPYLLANDPQCRYLENGKCNIHGNHPLFCRLYPLSFGYHSNTVFVNLIHCEGVNSDDEGSRVDQAFAKQTVAEMVQLEGDGFPKAYFSEEDLLTQGRMPLFKKDETQTLYSNFSNRRRLLLSFAEWLGDPLLDGIESASEKFQTVLLGPFSYLKKKVAKDAELNRKTSEDREIDIGTALSDVSKNFSPHVSKGRSELFTMKERGRIYAFDRRIDSTRDFDPEEEVELFDYYDAPVKLTANVAFGSIILEQKALNLELSYVQEILGRVGMGGLPYYLPLDVSLERLLIIIQELEAYANYLAQREVDKNGIVNVSMMTESIRNTDTRIMDLLV